MIPSVISLKCPVIEIKIITLSTGILMNANIIYI
jgi:hypothetical protein